MQKAPLAKLVSTGAMAALLIICPGTPAVAGHPASLDRQRPAPADPVDRAIAANSADHDDPADHTWDPASVIPINLSNPSPTAAAEPLIKPTVITIKSAGTYQISGTLTDGRIVVDTEDDGMVRLILDNAEVTSAKDTPLEVKQADEVMIVLPAETANVLSDSPPATEPETLASKAKAAVYSVADLTITGTGSLTVTSRDDSGIISEDGLVIDSGTLVVNAKKDGIHGDDYVMVNSGRITVTAGKAGIEATNEDNPALGYVSMATATVTVNSGADGIKAETDVIINGGRVSIKSGGGNTVTVPEDDHARGVHAKVSVVIGAGRITADAADTAIHSSGSVTISGGTLNLTASTGSEGDGVHANTTLDVIAGDITVVNSYEGLEALKLTVRGGTIRAIATNDGLNASEDNLGEFDTSANAFIRIDGGTLTIQGGDDGLDSNGTITMNGGSAVISPAYDGIDANGSFTMKGGTVVINGSPVNDNFQDGLEVLGGIILSGGTLLSAAISASYNAPASSSTQGWLSVKLDAAQPAGSVVQLVSGTTVIAAYKSGKAFQSILLTSNKITNAEPYDVYVGGTVSGSNLGGLYSTGDLAGATKVTTVTAGRFAR